MSQYEKMLKNEMDDEIELAGLEALVPEELEKHLILNSNRLRTFKDARREVVTYVEAKFGSRSRSSEPSDTGLRELRCWDQFSLVSRRKRVIRFACWVFQVRWSTFSTRLQCKQESKQSSGRGNQGKSWPKSE